VIPIERLLHCLVIFQPPLLEDVYSDLEMVKRALFNPTLGNAVLGEVVSKLHKSFKQLINEVSNIDYK